MHQLCGCVCVCACVRLVEGVPLCTPCGSAALSAPRRVSLSGGAPAWHVWNERRAPLGGVRVFVPGAPAVGVFRRPGRSRCAPDPRVRRTARLGSAQRLSASAVSPVRSRWLSVMCGFSQSVRFLYSYRFRRARASRSPVRRPRAHPHSYKHLSTACGTADHGAPHNAQ